MSWQQAFESMRSEQLNKAFEYAKREVKIPDGKLVIITEPLYNDVTAFAIEHLLPYEILSKSLNCHACPEEWVKHWLKMLKFGLSFALLNKENDEVLAICFVDIVTSDTKYDPSLFKNHGNICLREFMHFCNKEAKVFDHFGLNEAVHINKLAVSVKYRNRGIGTQIVKAVLSFVVNLNLFPLAVMIECSSNFSKAIIEKQGFDTLYECRYSDYTVGGNMVICNTGEHKSVKIYGKLFDGKGQ